MTRRDPIGTLLIVGLLATLVGASRARASTSPAAETVKDANVNGLSGGGVTHVTTGSSPLSCGTFLLTFGWGVADGKPAFETCTSGCQGGIFGEGAGGAGQFSYATDVAIDGSEHVFVADRLRVARDPPRAGDVACTQTRQADGW
jgi:hypothetical protein